MPTANETVQHRVWEGRDSEYPGAVRAFVKKLRTKLGDSATNWDWVFTGRGVGYRMPRSDEA